MSQYQIGSYMSVGSCHSSYDGMISSSTNVSDERPSKEAQHIGSWLLSFFAVTLTVCTKFLKGVDLKDAEWHVLLSFNPGLNSILI